jgi:predicted secreted protein
MLENEGNDKEITDEDVRKATEVLEKAKKQNKMSLEYQSYAMK